MNVNMVSLSEYGFNRRKFHFILNILDWIHLFSDKFPHEYVIVKCVWYGQWQRASACWQNNNDSYQMRSEHETDSAS